MPSLGDIMNMMKLAWLARNPVVPSMAGKVVIITGSNTGIGKETARHLVKVGARVILACRNGDAARAAIQDLEKDFSNGGSAEWLPLDLSSMASVRSFVKKFNDLNAPLHALINNAGTNSMFGHNSNHTSDGLAWVMTVNYLGHFLLTELLVPKLKESAPSRVVNVSSFMHSFVQAKPADIAKTLVETDVKNGYQVSKLYNILHSNELHRRYAADGITANSVHPGAVNSDIWRTIPWYIRIFARVFFWLTFATNEVGSRSSVYAATTPELVGVGGKLFYDCREDQMSPLACDESFSKELWEISEKMVKGKGKK